jgi:putative glycosyltransferase
MNSSIPLSIVTTLYRSSPHIEEFHRRASAAARKVAETYEIIFVNDGSPDDSLERAAALQRQDPRVVIVDLSRNFGHHRALLAGLSYARGEMVFILDGDLEEEPEWLNLFEKTLRDQGADVVYGVQDKRKGNLLEQVSGWLFYKVFNKLSSSPIPANATIARLMSRRYVEALLTHHESEAFLPGLWHLTGYRQIPQTVHKHSKGSSTYSLARKVGLLVNAITSFSNKPLVFIFYTGFFICLVSGTYIAWLLWRRWQYGIPLMGWPSLIVSIWFLGGLTIFFLGILGIYLAKVFAEVKQRPRAIIRQVLR